MVLSSNKNNSKRSIISNLFSKSIIATFLCDDQDSKVRFISKILETLYNKEKIIFYVDIDTMFTVFLENNRNLTYIQNVILFRPKHEEFDDIIAEICSVNQANIDWIVFDSVTSFHNLNGNVLDYSKSNRKIGLYLSILRNITSNGGGKIIFTSMIRSRKKKGEMLWQQSYAGGKLLERRSDLILKLVKQNNQLLVSSIKRYDDSFEKDFSLDLD